MNAPEPTPRQIWPFPGGLHLDEHKAESTGTPIRVAPIPPLLIHPLHYSPARRNGRLPVRV